MLRTILSTLARNSAFNMFGRLSIKLLSFAFTILIIRWLGADGYGQYTLIWSHVLIFAMLSDAGLGMYTIREIAKQKENCPHLTLNVILLRLILAGQTMVLIIGWVGLLGYERDFILLTGLASMILLLYAIQDPLDVLLQATERFDLAAYAVIVGQVIFMLLGALFLMLGGHITGLIVAGLFNVIVSAGVAWYLMADYRSGYLRWQIEPQHWLGHLRTSFPFGLIRLWLNWSFKFDLVILSWYWSNDMLGWYSAAYAILSGVRVISNSINVALFPTFSRQYQQDEEEMSNVYQISLQFLLIIALPITGLTFWFTEELILLLFSTEFLPAATVLMIIVWAMPLTFATEFMRTLLLVTDREKIAVLTLSLTVLATVGLNLWLIPNYGFVGAAVVMVVGELLLLIFSAWYVCDELSPKNLLLAFSQPALATVALLLTAYLTTPLGWMGQIFFSVLVYLAALLMLGLLKSEDKALLWSHFRQAPTISKDDNSVAIPQTQPLVSVFIPAYNAGPFLAQAIDSVLAQTYDNYELIVIDDGSTDNTAEILTRYQDHPKIKLHRNLTNVGMSPNWNVGLGLCQGSLIAKLDADDFYEPNFLASIVPLFEQDPQVGFVFSGTNLVYPDGQVETEMHYLHTRIFDRNEFLPDLLKLCIIRSPTICVRRACYEQVGDFMEKMRIHTDWEMWVRIAANYKVGFVDQILANYRMSYGNNCTAMAAVDGRSIADLKLWLERLAQEPQLYQLTEAELTRLRWGMYELEMHFAGMAAYYNHNHRMKQAYTDFAETIAPATPQSHLQKLSQTRLNIQQGLCAFRDNQFQTAQQFFLRAIRTSPAQCTAPWIWNKLLLAVLGRRRWGIFYK